MKANSLEELVTNSNIAGELRNYTDWHTRLVKFAQLVADWQNEKDLEEASPLSVAYANRCFENGRQAMKEQMLKDAVEGEAVKIFEEGVASIHYNAFAIGEMAYFCKSDNIHLGQKVHIVVLKEEEE